MQTVQFRVDDNYLNIVMTLLNNLKIDIIKDLSIFKDKKSNLTFDKEDALSKFMAIDESKKCSDISQEFLNLGGSNCWSGDLEEMRENRINYGFGR